MDMQLVAPGHVTMSSREIAELCEKQHKHVLRDIETMLAQITEPNFGPSDFLSSYTDSTGRNLKEYRLPKDLTVTLITGYRADLRYRVVKRLEALEERARGTPVAGLPSDLLEKIDRSFGIIRMVAHKVTEIENALPTLVARMVEPMVAARIAESAVMLRNGRTAKQIWDAHGLPQKIRGSTNWFGNRLTEGGCLL